MLTSRERLLRTIRHQPVDRVPISSYELVGWNPDAWENQDPSYGRLMDRIRKDVDCLYMLNPGLRRIPVAPVETREWRTGVSAYVERTYRAGTRRLSATYRTDDGLHTTWTLEHLLKDISDIDAYLAIPYAPPAVDMEGFLDTRERLGDKGLMMMSVDDPICVGAELFEMGEFLALSVTETDRVKYLLDAVFERQLATLRSILACDVRDVVFRIVGPEYATPPYLPPELFDSFVGGYLRVLCREILAAGGIPRVHSHGRIARVLDVIADSGALCLDPIEPPPDGDILLSDVKRRYGDRLCLFGNIELRELETADEGRIDELVRAALGEAMEGGGFVLMPTAAPIASPLSKRTEANFLRMIDCALEHGRY